MHRHFKKHHTQIFSQLFAAQYLCLWLLGLCSGNYFFSLFFGFLLWVFGIFFPWLRKAVPCHGEALHLLLELLHKPPAFPDRSDTTLSPHLAKPKALPTGPYQNGYFRSVFCLSGVVRSSSMSSSYLFFLFPCLWAFLFLISRWFFHFHLLAFVSYWWNP